MSSFLFDCCSRRLLYHSAEGKERAADEVVAVMMPEPFYAVGASYKIFDQTSDEEVRELFERSRYRQQECVA
jgi:predicted phosphoribosyltransferase